jgi:hypothetical protein
LYKCTTLTLLIRHFRRRRHDMICPKSKPYHKL